MCWPPPPFTLPRNNAVHGPRGDSEGSAGIRCSCGYLVARMHRRWDGHWKTSLRGARSVVILPASFSNWSLSLQKVLLKLQCSKWDSTKFILRSHLRCQRLQRTSFLNALWLMLKRELLQQNCWKSLSSTSMNISFSWILRCHSQPTFLFLAF